jgi:hypothetical protein
MNIWGAHKLRELTDTGRSMQAASTDDGSKWCAHPAMHAALQANGFMHTKSSGTGDAKTSSYMHPTNGHVSTFSNGTWMHTDPGGGHVGAGTGVKSLNQHFK